MKIGTWEPKGFCALAPMAGAADRAFRELCVSYGASFCVSEMVSAKGIVMGDRKSDSLMEIGEDERPCAVQLFGSEPAAMAQAAVTALRHKPDFIDINMGCPAPKVTKTGAGSALLKDPVLAAKIVRAVKDAVPLPVTVKMRVGWDASPFDPAGFAQAMEAAGADMITVHGRTRLQMYAPPVDRSAIAAVKRAVRLPVIGNGDIDSPEAARLMLEETGCDFLMIGRGALGRPWLFRAVNAYLGEGIMPPEPDGEEKMRVLMRHAELICRYRGERIGITELRKHALWYTKGMRGGARLRSRFSTMKSLSELRELAEEITAGG